MPTFTDEYGVHITYYEWLVPQPKAVVHISHGVGEYALRYSALAEHLRAAGYSVVADDHRGHGQTGLDQHGGDHSKLGKLGPGGLRAAEAAIRRLGVLTRIAHPGVPLVMLGDSWGSLMAQRLLNRHPHDYDAVVLAATAYRMPGFMESGNLNKRHQHLGTTGNEWLSRDPRVHAAFAADPLCFPANILKLFGVVDALRLIGVPARALAADPPLLIMCGSDDSLGAERSAVKLAQAYRVRSGLSDVTAVVYEGARHEIFHELNTDEVLRDLTTWLDERFAGAGGGHPEANGGAE